MFQSHNKVQYQQLKQSGQSLIIIWLEQF